MLNYFLKYEVQSFDAGDAETGFYEAGVPIWSHDHTTLLYNFFFQRMLSCLLWTLQLTIYPYKSLNLSLNLKNIPQWSKFLSLRPTAVRSAFNFNSAITWRSHLLRRFQMWYFQLLWLGMWVRRNVCEWFYFKSNRFSLVFWYRKFKLEMPTVIILPDSDLVGYEMTFTLGRRNDIVSYPVRLLNGIEKLLQLILPEFIDGSNQTFLLILWGRL